MDNAMEGIESLLGAAAMDQGPRPMEQAAGIETDLLDVPEVNDYAKKDPMAFRSDILQGVEEVDPALVARFKGQLSSLDITPEVIDALGKMVDQIMGDPANYDEIRAEYLIDDEEGVFAELLPPVFDAAYFQALEMALDQLAVDQGSMPEGFADGGVARLNPIASQIADMGRNGDTMLAHVTPSEARMLRARGGSGTINPVTGMPEFFIGKVVKAVKGVVKGAAKAVKGVVGAVKDFAQSDLGRIALTIAAGWAIGPAVGLLGGAGASGLAGAAFGLSGAAAFGVNAAIAGTVVGLASGQKLGDALKGGVISGAMAGLGGAAFGTPAGYESAGASAAGTAAGEGAKQSLSEAVMGDAAKVSVDPVTGAVTTPMDMNYLPTDTVQYNLTTPDISSQAYFPPVEQSIGTMGGGAPQNIFTGPFAPPAGAPGAAPGVTPLSYQVAPPVSPNAFGGGMSATQRFDQMGGLGSSAPTSAGIGEGTSALQQAPPAAPPGSIPPPQETSLFGSLKEKATGIWDDYLSPNRNMPTQMEIAQEAANLQKTYAEQGLTLSGEEVIKQATAKLTPGMISRYGPLAAAGLGATALMGGFEAPEEEPVPDIFQETGQDLLDKYPEKYGLNWGGSRTIAPVRIPQYAEGGIASFARGGKAKFPRKNGHISGPGGPKDDKVPAMLSDGEFVFTAKAVRNMGNGSRRKGAKKMYALMKALENKA